MIQIFQWFKTKLKKEKLLVFNILTEHDFNIKSHQDKQTLLCEFSVAAKTKKQARIIAQYQIDRVNQKLASNFKIDSLWVLKQSIRNVKRSGNVVDVEDLTENDLNILNYQKHFSYLKEEFDYCKSKDEYCSVQ